MRPQFKCIAKHNGVTMRLKNRRVSVIDAQSHFIVEVKNLDNGKPSIQQTVDGKVRTTRWNASKETLEALSEAIMRAMYPSINIDKQIEP